MEVLPIILYFFIFIFFKLMIFILFHYNWITVFCQFSTVQQSDAVTHACTHHTLEYDTPFITKSQRKNSIIFLWREKTLLS